MRQVCLGLQLNGCHYAKLEVDLVFYSADEQFFTLMITGSVNATNRKYSAKMYEHRCLDIESSYFVSSQLQCVL